MALIYVVCPNCNRTLTYDSRYAGTTQPCPHCSRQLVVPGSSALVAPNPPPPQLQAVATTATAHGEWHAPPYQHERSVDAHTSRRIKMGQGCFGMLAVMFAVALVGWGVGILSDAEGKTVFALSAIVAGLAGLPAFIFFGYFAVETAHKAQDTGRR